MGGGRGWLVASIQGPHLGSPSQVVNTVKASVSPCPPFRWTGVLPTGLLLALGTKGEGPDLCEGLLVTTSDEDGQRPRLDGPSPSLSPGQTCR